MAMEPRTVRQELVLCGLAAPRAAMGDGGREVGYEYARELV